MQEAGVLCDDCTWKELAPSLKPFKRINQKRKFCEDLNTEFAHRALKQKPKPVFSAQPQQQHLFPALATREQGKALGLLRGQPTAIPIILCTCLVSKELCKNRRKNKEVALREAEQTHQPERAKKRCEAEDRLGGSLFPGTPHIPTQALHGE